MRFVPVLLRPGSVARQLSVAFVALGLGLTLTACSSSRTAQTDVPAWVGANPPVPVPSRQAAYEPAPGDPIKDVPIEPGHRPNSAPDDPSEPYSPNYGGARTQPLAKVSDFDVPAKDPEPTSRRTAPREAEAARAYIRRTTTTAAAD
jgi:hypothetical protein